MEVILSPKLNFVHEYSERDQIVLFTRGGSEGDRGNADDEITVTSDQYEFWSDPDVMIDDEESDPP